MTTILHPTDFSESAVHAEASAVQLAKALGGEVVLLHVTTEPMLYGEGFLGTADVQAVYRAARKWAADRLAERAAAIGRTGVPARFLLTEGVPFREIVAAAATEGADFIVMGTAGRTGLDRLMLGSVAERVVRLAGCPVVTVRPPATAESARAKAS